jgi:hypothetical protein
MNREGNSSVFYRITNKEIYEKMNEGFKRLEDRHEDLKVVIFKHDNIIKTHNKFFKIMIGSIATIITSSILWLLKGVTNVSK